MSIYVIMCECMIEGLEFTDPSETGYMLGRLVIGGTPHHVDCYRVQTNDAGDQFCMSDDDVRREKFELARKAVGAEEDGFDMVEIEGLEGEWVCIISPYCR